MCRKVFSEPRSRNKRSKWRWLFFFLSERERPRRKPEPELLAAWGGLELALRPLAARSSPPATATPTPTPLSWKHSTASKWRSHTDFVLLRRSHSGRVSVSLSFCISGTRRPDGVAAATGGPSREEAEMIDVCLTLVGSCSVHSDDTETETCPDGVLDRTSEKRRDPKSILVGNVEKKGQCTKNLLFNRILFILRRDVSSTRSFCSSLRKSVCLKRHDAE